MTDRDAPPAEGPRRRPALHGLRALGAPTLAAVRTRRVPALAAEVAFFTLLSLPSLLLVLLGAVGFVADLLGADASSGVRDEFLRLAATFLSPETVEGTIRPFVDEMLSAGPAVGLLSIGLIVAAWSASKATKSLLEAIAIASGEQPKRRALKSRFMAVAVTLGAIAVAAVLLPLLVAGPEAGGRIADAVGLGDAFGFAWAILYWPIVAGVVVAILAGLYRLSVPGATSWRRNLPGAALAAVVWLLGGFALRLYANLTILGSDSIFGPLAAPVVLLLWLYLTAVAVLLGATLNAELLRLHPNPEPRVTEAAEITEGRWRASAKATAGRPRGRPRNAPQ